MSMEFTHLAQLTGKDKYYDAIARITDNLEEFQKKTRLPGMWPTYIDISGCKRVDYSSTYNKPLQNPIVKGPSIPQRIPPTKAQSVAENVPLSENPDFAPAPETVAEIAEPQEDPRKDKTAPMVEPVKDSSIVPGEKLSEGGHKFIPLKLPPPLVLKPEESSSVKKAGSVKKVGSGKKVAPGKKGSKREPLGRTAGSGLNKRQLDEDEDEARRAPLQAISTPTSDVKDEDFAAAPLETRPLCEKIGFESTSTYIDEEYTLGGMSDSTYEYLPKQYLLLGGVEEKYRTMYEAAVKTIKENILFRPMLPDNKDILVAGKLIVSPPPTTDSTGSTTQAKPNTLDPQQEHLTCFAGGMFGMGAKIFNSPDDLDIARKLTEGCIWSYKMTATKIMPEGFQLIPCQSMKTCEWNQTKYWDTLDPWADSRLESYKESKLRYEEQMKSASSQYEQDLKTMETPAPTPINRGIGSYETEATPTPIIDLAAKAVDLLDKRKRQLDDSEDSEARRKAIGGHLGGINDPPTNIKLVEEESPLPSKILPVFPHVYSPKVPASQEEYVETRIIEERLPIGVTRITGRNYILR
jgi:mannosyl-oligosaccharide alpha-1,2-mannosidase